jgi:hypothetical protein
MGVLGTILGVPVVPGAPMKRSGSGCGLGADRNAKDLSP